MKPGPFSYFQDEMYARGGRSRERAIFRMKCMHAEAGAESERFSGYLSPLLFSLFPCLQSIVLPIYYEEVLCWRKNASERF
jgi:hypothetical protein